MLKKILSSKRAKVLALAIFAIAALAPIYYIQSSQNADAFCNPCTACPPNDCPMAAQLIVQEHATRIPQIQQYITQAFIDHRDWLANDFLEDNFIPALQRMTEQLSVVGMNQIFAIGTFFDAKHQLETQQLFQELQVQAHKDYQPSESFCTFGTAVRSMAHTESAAKTATLALSQRQLARHLGNRNIGGSENVAADKKNRWNQFTALYCDPRDNNWVNGQADTGLTSVCNNIAGRPNIIDAIGNSHPYNRDRINIDIDYTRLVENRRTLDLYGGAWVGAGDEVDVMALGNNLYGHTVPTRNLSESSVADEELGHRYLELRSVMAKRSVAENSFNSIVGLKSQGSTILNSPGPITAAEPQTNRYLGRILQDLGIPEDEVVEYLGLSTSSPYVSTRRADASYFTTLEILAKKIYQNPNFYANLYDTPANVKRKSAALKAIELMLDRAIYESQLRQEMAMSVLLSSRLKKFADEANKNLE